MIVEKPKTYSHAFLTVKCCHVIASYIQRCSESQFEALSKRKLFRLLQQLKATQRRSLAGIVDIHADGWFLSSLKSSEPLPER